jgi:hypothetical protein
LSSLRSHSASLTNTGDELVDQINVEDDLADMEISVDVDDEEELFDYGKAPESVGVEICNVNKS